MNKIQLFDYQKDTVNGARDLFAQGFKRPILGSPTGAGKTVMASFIAEQAIMKFKNVGLLAHRTELVEQGHDTMKKFGLPVDRIDFNTVQTYVKSPSKIPNNIDFWLLDECHIGNYRKFIDSIAPNIPMLGLTATPLSASNKNPLNEVFDSISYKIGVRELIEYGRLARPEYHLYRVDESKLVKSFSGEFTEDSQTAVLSDDDFMNAFSKRIGKTIIYCSSIKETIRTFEMIGDCRKFMVHSEMTMKERKNIVSSYKFSKSGVMVNCGILTVGFDDSEIETNIIKRATMSLPLYCQMVGRSGRVNKDTGKNKHYVFDLGGNFDRHMPWEADRDWESIFKLQGASKKEGAAPTKKCVSCDAIIFASQNKCPYCEAVQPQKEKQILSADSIDIVDTFEGIPDHLFKPFNEMSVTELVERASYGSPDLRRPYKNGWIINQLKGREGFEDLMIELAKVKGYKTSWAKKQIELRS